MEKYHDKKDKIKAGTLSAKVIVLGIIPFIVLSGLILFLASPGGMAFLHGGIALPSLTIEKIEFQEHMIIAFVRNTGQIDTTISQADINDRIHPAGIEPSKHLPRFASAKITIPFSWNFGEPYEIGVTTNDGTRFSASAEAAVPTPAPGYKQAAIFAIIGTYVGIIPIMIGLLWYPFIRHLSSNKYNFFLSLTAGLLIFLGIDALIESNEIAVTKIADTFKGQMLIIITTIITFLGLMYIANRLTKRSRNKLPNIVEKKVDNEQYKSESSTFPVSSSYGSQLELIKPVALSMMIAIGIGLHNFGEGLAIGSAILIGEIALGTFLIIGFAIHNTTEGLAIVAPLTRLRKLNIKRLILLGLIAGVPTILGVWIGGFLHVPLANVIFIAIGAGAIFQVTYQIYLWLSSNMTSKAIFENGYIIGGLVCGIMIMYLTGLII